MEVQPGEDVLLLCTNSSQYEAPTFWLRLVNRTKISCISVMYYSKSQAEFCDGIQNDKFNMSSNITTLFLSIKQVDLFDSGLYFCGFYANGRPVFSVIHLNVEGKLSFFLLSFG